MFNIIFLQTRNKKKPITENHQNNFLKKIKISILTGDYEFVSLMCSSENADLQEDMSIFCIVVIFIELLRFNMTHSVIVISR
jgi:hypothetical protein